MAKRREISIPNPERVGEQRSRSGSSVALSITRMSKASGQSSMDVEVPIEMNDLYDGRTLTPYSTR